MSNALNYENLLQDEEKRIRKLLSNEITLKLQCEKFSQTIDELEKEKILLKEQIVSKNYLILFINIDRIKKEMNTVIT